MYSHVQGTIEISKKVGYTKESMISHNNSDCSNISITYYCMEINSN